MRIEENKALRKAILQELAATEKRIDALVKLPAVIACLGINPDVPLVINVGTDTELRVADEMNIPFGVYSRSDAKQVDYQQAVYQATKRRDLPREPKAEGDRLEIKSSPDMPRAFISSVERIFEACRKTAEEMGLRYQERSFHLHTTLRSKGTSVLAGTPGRSLFAQLLINQILQDQIQMPSLFIEPRKAEKESGRYSITGEIGLNIDLKCGSLEYKVGSAKYANDSPTFEQRLATMVPYVPVLMMLSAIEEVLKKISTFAKVPEPSKEWGLHENIPVHLGKGGYEHFLKKTIENGQLEQRFPHLASRLYAQIFDDYHAYVRITSRYAPEEKAGLLSHIDRMQADHRRTMAACNQPDAVASAEAEMPAPNSESHDAGLVHPSRPVASVWAALASLLAPRNLMRNRLDC